MDPLSSNLVIPETSESIWSPSGSEGQLNEKVGWLNAAMYLLSKQQRQQQPDFTARQDQNNDIDYFLDRLALLFARKKTKDTPRHVTATGLVTTDKNLYVYIAKNGGPDDVDRKFVAWLQEWFQYPNLEREGKDDFKHLLVTWKDRITYYKARVQKASRDWDKDLESFKNMVATYFSEAGTEFDRSQLEAEWKDTYGALKSTEIQDDDDVWVKYYNFWKKPRSLT
ncbi:hypothetical protein F5Y14DRAFT_465884 [Nemania sp. NC0429]|nr:hypothetical protein F5Y14DRAFT_465884 [Nemania sp. NC0429]